MNLNGCSSLLTLINAVVPAALPPLPLGFFFVEHQVDLFSCEAEADLEDIHDVLRAEALTVGPSPATAFPSTVAGGKAACPHDLLTHSEAMSGSVIY